MYSIPPFAAEVAVEPVVLPLPVVEGKLRAGFPSPADDFAIRRQDLNDLLITHPLATLLLRLGIIAMVVFGAYHNAAMAWALGDIGVGLMAWLNVIAILILQKPALLALRDYERQKKLGLDPVFDPEALGIRNADFWKRRG